MIRLQFMASNSFHNFRARHTQNPALRSLTSTHTHVNWPAHEITINTKYIRSSRGLTAPGFCSNVFSPQIQPEPIKKSSLVRVLKQRCVFLFVRFVLLKICMVDSAIQFRVQLLGELGGRTCDTLQLVSNQSGLSTSPFIKSNK